MNGQLIKFPVFLSSENGILVSIMTKSATVYRTPPMSPSILAVTIIIIVIPIALLFFGLRDNDITLLFIALVFYILVAGVWLWMRPSHYLVNDTGLMIIWPLRKMKISGEDMVNARVLDRKALKDELGLAVRIGVGGIFGGFGFLWTRKKGLIRFYITRTDRFVMIDRKNGRPVLISADDPVRLVENLGAYDHIAAT